MTGEDADNVWRAVQPGGTFGDCHVGTESMSPEVNPGTANSWNRGAARLESSFC